ncbi:ferredoxin [bacterium]|nr:ferredoxin [bacterium]
MKATVDPDACISCELCVEICPEVFEMDDESGKAVAKVNPVPADAEESAQDSADQCPTEAIAIE